MTRGLLFHPASLAALALLALSAAGMNVALKAYGVSLVKKPIEAPDGRRLAAIPAETPGWTRLGADHLLSAEEVEELDTDNYLSRVYVERNPADPQRPAAIVFHAAYYTGPAATTQHVPERCNVGAGMALVGGPWIVTVPLDRSTWEPVRDLPEGLEGPVYTTRLPYGTHSSAPGLRVRLPAMPEEGLQMRVTEYASPGGGRQFAGYFFIVNGRTRTSAQQAQLAVQDLWTDYSFYLKVQFTSAQARSPEELAAWAGRLLDDLFGELMRCAPDWVDVLNGDYPPRGRGADRTAT